MTNNDHCCIFLTTGENGPWSGEGYRDEQNDQRAKMKSHLCSGSLKANIMENYHTVISVATPSPSFLLLPPSLPPPSLSSLPPSLPSVSMKCVRVPLVYILCGAVSQTCSTSTEGKESEIKATESTPAISISPQRT